MKTCWNCGVQARRWELPKMWALDDGRTICATCVSFAVTETDREKS